MASIVQIRNILIFISISFFGVKWGAKQWAGMSGPFLIAFAL